MAFAYSKKTGKPILGTYEMVPGRAEIIDGSFKLGEDGELDRYEHDGQVRVLLRDIELLRNREDSPNYGYKKGT